MNTQYNTVQSNIINRCRAGQAGARAGEGRVAAAAGGGVPRPGRLSDIYHII